MGETRGDTRVGGPAPSPVAWRGEVGSPLAAPRTTQMVQIWGQLAERRPAPPRALGAHGPCAWVPGLGAQR